MFKINIMQIMKFITAVVCFSLFGFAVYSMNQSKASPLPFLICACNLELKHLLLKFVFKEMILTEGELTYELNFPFSEFEKAYFYEKRSQFFQGSQDEENQGFEDNKTDENAKSFGPKIALKNQRVALKNATLLQSGWGGWIRQPQSLFAIYTVKSIN